MLVRSRDSVNFNIVRPTDFQADPVAIIYPLGTKSHKCCLVYVTNRIEKKNMGQLKKSIKYLIEVAILWAFGTLLDVIVAQVLS